MRVRVMLVKEGRPEKAVISGPKDVMAYMAKEIKHLDREHFWRIDLTIRNQVMHHELVSLGSASASIVHPRELYKAAILSSAGGIIIIHNHPSGDPSPSDEDKSVTQRIKRAGDLLGIPLMDHLVVTDDRYFSFKEAGLL